MIGFRVTAMFKVNKLDVSLIRFIILLLVCFKFLRKARNRREYFCFAHAEVALFAYTIERRKYIYI